MNNLIAQTRAGAVAGDRLNGVLRFRGIPFTGRTDGPGRFAPPVHPNRWDGIRPCLSWAPMVPQVPDAVHRDQPFYADYLFGRFHALDTVEDGLYLNLWTPDLDWEAKRPVLVWLHGGGFTTGIASRPREDGANLAKSGDVVVVAPTHRLGAFGYAWFDQLRGRPGAANVGLLDIVAALEWVQENIRAFGGDPDNVTIMGESGGGMKVCALMVMPAARHLFHKASCLGGALIEGHASSALTPDQARTLTKRLAAHLSVFPDQLCELPFEALVRAQTEIDKRPIVWRPVIDGDTLPGHPDRLIADGHGSDVPMLIGSAAHEGDFLSQINSFFAVKSLDDLASIASLRVGAATDTLATAYGGFFEPHEAALAMLGDYYLRVPSILTATAQSKAKRCAYMYLFDWTQPRAPRVRATHGAETVFIFGNLEATGAVRGFEEAAALSAQVQKAWVAFMRCGDPNHDALPYWPPYSAGDRLTMQFDTSPVVLTDPGAAGRRAWTSVLRGNQIGETH